MAMAPRNIWQAVAWKSLNRTINGIGAICLFAYRRCSVLMLIYLVARHFHSVNPVVVGDTAMDVKTSRRHTDRPIDQRRTFLNNIETLLLLLLLFIIVAIIISSREMANSNTFMHCSYYICECGIIILFDGDGTVATRWSVDSCANTPHDGRTQNNNSNHTQPKFFVDIFVNPLITSNADLRRRLWHIHTRQAHR